MGITALGAIGILFDEVKVSVLFTDPKKVTGNAYRLQQPLNSKKEDVIINDLGMGNGAVQHGILNLNVYVNNLEVTQDGFTDRSQPDWSRLEELEGLAKTALGDGKDVICNDGEISFCIQQSTVIPDTNNQHYLNFRVEFYSINN